MEGRKDTHPPFVSWAEQIYMETGKKEEGGLKSR